jgi:hypothetical protein
METFISLNGARDLDGPNRNMTKPLRHGALSAPRDIVRGARCLFGPPAPDGVISLNTWFEERGRYDGARLIELPPPETHPRRPPRSLAGLEVFCEASESYVATENPPRRVAEIKGASVATDRGLLSHQTTE